MLKCRLISAAVVAAVISMMWVGCSKATSLAITTISLKNGAAGVAYDQKVRVVGGKAPYIWLITAGSLPNGLRLDSGEISGTPLSSGSFDFTILVEDKSGATTNMNLSITIQRVNATIATNKLANGKVGTRYSQTLVAKGGEPPYRWSLADGNLPVGLTLNGDIIAGTPVVADVFYFTILLEDNAGSQVPEGLSIKILPEP